MKKVFAVVYGLIAAILIGVAGLVAVSALNLPGNFKLFSVQSGSMEPAIPMGSIVVVQPQKTYQMNDVVTFSEVGSPKVPVTHRIVEIKDLDGKISFITRGDANKSADMGERSRANALGKVIFSLPFLGYPVSFAKTKDGFLFLIIIPATLIVYNELASIKNEVGKLLLARKKRKLNPKEEIKHE